MDVSQLPPINATLNGISTVLLLSGYVAIKRGKESLHRNLMLSAVGVSALFLACYLVYHFNIQAVTKYQGLGLDRYFYYFILATHVPLATIMVPFIFKALYDAKNDQRAKHRKLVRWLWPVWLYVSITGVVIYFMLYELHL